MERPAIPRQPQPVWWLNPAVLVWAFLLPLYLVLWIVGLVSEGTISTARTFHFFNVEFGLLGLLGLLALGVGTLIPLRPASCQPMAFGPGVPLLLLALGVLSLLGYLYWFRDLIFRPGEIIRLLMTSQSASLALKESIDRQAGIASLAQFGLPFVLICTAIQASEPGRLSTFCRLLYWLVLAAIAFRAFVWAERLALIEAGVGVLLVKAAFLPRNGVIGRRLLHVFPFVAVIGVVALFGIGEYFRSWTAYYQYTQNSFIGFISQRLANYYYTSLNTGSGHLAVFAWPTFEMATVLEWMHRMPFVGKYFKQFVGEGLNPNPQADAEFFQQFGDPEFNNIAGLFTVYFDLGIPLGTFFFFIGGILARYLHANWLLGRLPLGILYYLALMTLLELFRYFYIGSPRSFPVLLGLLAGLVLSTGHARAVRPIGASRLSPAATRGG